MRRLLLPFALCLTLAGCGGSGPVSVSETSFGRGAEQVWLFRPDSKPKSVVVFLHGFGGPVEETPENHLPWLRHLAGEMNAVIYPRYERTEHPGDAAAVLVAVGRALRRLGKPHVPLVVIGYSRGGRLAVEYAAVAPELGQHPAAVLSVFPGLLSPAEPEVPLGGLDPRIPLVFMYGTADTAVGGEGVRDLLRRLEAANYPPDRIRLVAVRSRGTWHANHFAPMDTSPRARHVFWDAADRLIDSVRK
ncbi:MAG: hypothetical protein WBB74_08980 [Gaiellaceae bacterium]